jgi:hypothetical protein
VILEAWSPELRRETLRLGVDAGSLLLTTFAIYELRGETAVVATAPFSAELEWRRQDPALAAIAERESERVARMLERMRRASRRRTLGGEAA